MSKRGQCVGMSEEEFKNDLALIAELEDEVNRATDWQLQQTWCRDRIEQLRLLYQHMEVTWWPKTGLGQEQERGSDDYSL